MLTFTAGTAAATLAQLRAGPGAGTYRKTAKVRATRLDAPLTWITAAGSVMVAATGDWVLENEAGRRWSVKAEIFAATYSVAGGGFYVKSALTQLVRMSEEFVVHTLEGLAAGAAGDFLAFGPAGEMYPVPAAAVAADYERAR